MKEAANGFTMPAAQPIVPQHQPSYMPDVYGSYNDPQDIYKQQQYDRVILKKIKNM